MGFPMTVFEKTKERSGALYPLIENRVQGRILSHIHAQAHSASKKELTELLNSSRTKVSAEVGRLMDLGLLAEDGIADSNGGRRSKLLGIPQSAGLVAAIIIGAYSVEVALTTLGSEIISHRRESVDGAKGPISVLKRVRKILRELLEEEMAGPADILALGVGAPGSVEQTSKLLASPPMSPGWDRFPIREAFAGEYAAPVFLDNDVNMMAVGEHWGGVARGIDEVVFVKIDMDIGAGIISNGHLQSGSHGFAGEIGHISVDPGGVVCACGNTGCLDVMAAAPAMTLQAERCAKEGLSPALAEILADTGELNVRDIGQAAARGDNEALKLIRNSGRLVGGVLASLVSILNPSMIILGGDVSEMGGHSFLAEVRSAVYHRSLPSATRSMQVTTGKLGEAAGVTGASVLAARRILEVSSENLINPSPVLAQ